MKPELQKSHIGISGTGFIAKGLMLALANYPDLDVSCVLTRRPVGDLKDLPVSPDQITHDPHELIAKSDLIVECSGDVLHGSLVVEQALLADVPVVTMNAELQLTTGSYLAKLGTFIEAEGDQPGTLAVFDHEVRSMGFTPIVYGNIKGFLNKTPKREEMEYWAKRQGIRLDKVTAFTDGTKVQVEQALVANGLSAGILEEGMSAYECKSYEDGAKHLGELADQAGYVVSDYVVSAGAPAGVFIVAKHESEQADYLKYLKLGDGPNYVLIKPFHLCHLEIAKTIRHVLHGENEYHFNNGLFPTIQVVAETKRRLKKDELMEAGVGGFALRGRAVRINQRPDAVPIGLIAGARIKKSLSANELVTFDHVDLPHSRALEMWQQILTDLNSNSELDDKVIRPVTPISPLRHRHPFTAIVGPHHTNKPWEVK